MAFDKFISGFIGGKTLLRITSPFGVWRKTYAHDGLDVGIPSGTTLKSPVNGKIYSAGLRGRGGLTIGINYQSNGKNIYLFLMHLHTLNVSVGDIVTAGQTIGTTGGLPTDKPNCGHSTGAHLHIGVRIGNIPYDPAPFISDGMTNKSGGVFKGSKPSNQISVKVEDIDLKSISVFSKIDVNLQSLVDETCTEETPVITNRKITDKPAPGIWQIVKLLIDDSIVDKQLMSSDISTQQGSLLNFFKKVCQEPLVEFMTDTYGSQFYFIARRPPTDRVGMRFMLSNNGCLDLSDEEIISSNLKWHGDGGYSWYQFLPTAELLGIKESTLFVPAVFFPEYASIWGSKPLIVESNYYSYKESGKWNTDIQGNQQNQNAQISSAINDFKYLIESNAYLPFTREGTLIVNLNRSIKRGTFVQLTNGEIFHVDSVSHDYGMSGGSVSATTTLNVSRGIVSDFIETKKIEGQLVSYFKIIDFGDETMPVDYSNWKSVVSKWKVNPEVFGFFLARQQMHYKSMEYQKMKKEVSAFTSFGNVKTALENTKTSNKNDVSNFNIKVPWK